MRLPSYITWIPYTVSGGSVLPESHLTFKRCLITSHHCSKILAIYLKEDVKIRYTRGLISFVVIAMLVGVGSLMLSTDHARAQVPETDCLLTIEKVATPANNVAFPFSVTGDITNEFTLMDPGNTTTDIGLDTGDIPDVITITEEPPAGWELESIECTLSPPGCNDGGPVPCLNVTIDEATNSITAECLDGDEGSCTFTNVKLVVTNVPTLSEWGLIAMAAILGITGFMVMRRRNVTA